MSRGTVLLVRHGETEWNRTRRIQGWAPVGLNETGREQARATGRFVADSYAVDRVVASDLRRTRETARLVRQSLGLDHDRLAFDPAWRERHFGVYQGLTYEALFDGHPEFAIGKSGVRAIRAEPEGGESVLTARERILRGWADLTDDLDETVVVVTHGGPIHVVLADLAGRDLVSEIDGHHTDNCSVTEIAVEDGEPALVARNRTPATGEGSTE